MAEESTQEQQEPEVMMYRVISEQIFRIGYDMQSQTLYVQFTKGVGRYKYPGVSMAEFTKLREAESLGLYFNSNIKGKFAHVYLPPKVEKVEA